MAGKPKTRKSNQLSVRLDPKLQAEVEQACELTGMEPALLLRECLRAFVEEVKATGEIRFPLAIVPKSRGVRRSSLIAEDEEPPARFSLNEIPGEYPAKPKI